MCDFNKFEDGVFEKNPLFCIPYLGQKRPFFGTEGPVLTPKHENIVLLVVTTQNIAFQGLKWSPMDNVLFRVFRPLTTPPGPPRPPHGPGGPKMAQMHFYQSSVDN